MGLLDGKKALIMGVANKHTIAWGIAQAFSREGCELAFTYAIERLKDNVDGARRDAPERVQRAGLRVRRRQAGGD